MQRSFTIVTLGILAVLASGCATGGATDTESLEPSASRGQLIAEARCASCHAMTGEAEPGRPPAFATLAARYRAHSLRNRLTEIDETGHFNMPPLRLGDADVADIAAWLDSLPLP
jgi:mono/diheme cytochrome c family protein